MVKAVSLILITLGALYLARVTPDSIKRTLDNASKEHATVGALDGPSDWG